MAGELWLALRHLKGRGTFFLSSGSLVSAGGAALGVFAMSVVLAVMNGLADDLQKRILQVEPHIRMVWEGPGDIPTRESVASLLEHEHVASVTPFVKGEAMVVSGDRVAGAVLLGLPPETDGGDWLGSAVRLPREGLADDKLIVGALLAQRLWADRGRRVLVVSPREVLLTPPGIMPAMRPAYVAGLLESGLPDYDAVLVLATERTAGRLLGPGAAQKGLQIRLHDLSAAPRVADQLRRRLRTDSDWSVRDWTEENKALLSALRLEKAAMFLVVGLIMVVAAFNIAGTLSRVVLEKRSNLGMLMAMGATRTAVTRLFLLQGLVVGATGAAVGTVLGQIACVLLQRFYPVPLPTGLLPLEHLPMRSNPLDVVVTAVVALGLSCLAAVVPARRASRLDPCTAMRA